MFLLIGGGEPAAGWGIGAIAVIYRIPVEPVACGWLGGGNSRRRQLSPPGALRAGIGRLPAGVQPRFIASVAFDRRVLQDDAKTGILDAKTGILIGSLVSGVIGVALLAWDPTKAAETQRVAPAGTP